MAQVKGPNGLVLTVSDDLADSLLRSQGYERVEVETKAEPKATKATTPKSSSRK
jgi:hypothetical protein